MRRFTFWASSLALVFALGTSRVHSQENVQELHANAQEAYLAGDHALSVESYETLVAAGIRDADIYFNLGVAYMAADEPGLAILNLERALRLRSGDTDARETLELFRQEVTRREADARGEATLASNSSVVEAFFRPVPTELLEPAALGLWTLLFISIIFLLRTSKEAHRIRLGIATVAIGLLATLSITGVSVRQSWWSDGEQSIYTGRTGPVRQGPDRRTDIVDNIVTGSPCRILQTDTDYAEIQTTAGTTGWVPLESVQSIDR